MKSAVASPGGNPVNLMPERAYRDSTWLLGARGRGLFPCTHRYLSVPVDRGDMQHACTAGCIRESPTKDERACKDDCVFHFNGCSFQRSVISTLKRYSCTAGCFCFLAARSGPRTTARGSTSGNNTNSYVCICVCVYIYIYIYVILHYTISSGQRREGVLLVQVCVHCQEGAASRVAYT